MMTERIKLLIGIAIVTGAIVSAIVMGGRPYFPGPGDFTACTEEALMCPDGSGVGRTGSECRFSPCPNAAESYVGELIQQGGDFFLVIAASEGSPFEVNYALPLKFRISNAVQDMVGRTLVVKGNFTEGATLEVETMEILENGNEVEVGAGKTGYASGVRITLHSVIQDNRCPIDVVCIEGGAITARVTLKSNTDEETFNMPSDEVPHAFDSYKVSIIGVSPDRISTEEPNPAEYRIRFRVEKLQ